MNIVVTGGAGFIGSHIVDYYIIHGHHVTVVDDLSTGKFENVNERATFVQLDLNETKSLLKLFRSIQPDIVNHHAANASVAASMRDPIADATQNILGTISLLEACRLTRIRKFIYISSGGIICDNQNFLTNLYSAYAISKYAGEQYTQLYGSAYGFAWTILRYANVYGPRQNPYGEAGVVAIFLQNLFDGVTPKIHWDGEQTRDFIYVNDCARANLLALDGGNKKIYNIGTGTSTSINNLFHAALQVSGKEMIPHYISRRPNDIRHSCLDCSDARRDLGWRSTVSLQDGLHQTWDEFGIRSKL